MLLVSIGIVCADRGVAATPETQAISTVTSTNVVGIMTETDAVAWTTADYPFEGYQIYSWDPAEPNKLTPYSLTLLSIAEARYTTAYDKSVSAIGGQTTFLGSMDTDTGDRALTERNIDAKTAVQFIPASEGGVAIGSENIMIDGTAMPTTASDHMLCPFSAQPYGAFPAYCNIVSQGSAYQLDTGSVVTSADNRFVGTDATIPVVQDYAIDIRGIMPADGTTAPATGSASSYIRAHIQEDRSWSAYVYNEPKPEDPNSLIYLGLPTKKAEDLTYAETSSASGVIGSFAKSTGYSSQASATPIQWIATSKHV